MGFTGVRQRPGYGTQWMRAFANQIPSAFGYALQGAIKGGLKKAFDDTAEREQKARDDREAERQMQIAAETERYQQNKAHQKEMQAERLAAQREMAKMRQPQEGMHPAVKTASQAMLQAAMPGEASRVQGMGLDWEAPEAEPIRKGADVIRGAFGIPVPPRQVDATPGGFSKRVAPFLDAVPEEKKKFWTPYRPADVRAGEGSKRRQHQKEMVDIRGEKKKDIKHYGAGVDLEKDAKLKWFGTQAGLPSTKYGGQMPSVPEMSPYKHPISGKPVRPQVKRAMEGLDKGMSKAFGPSPQASPAAIPPEKGEEVRNVLEGMGYNADEIQSFFADPKAFVSKMRGQ